MKDELFSQEFKELERGRKQHRDSLIELNQMY
jgi:hypothetical protein